MRVACVATHPVQYQAPFLRALGRTPGLELRVLYACLPDPAEQGVGFDREFAWDVPLLEGYAWERIEGVRRRGESLAAFGALAAPGIGARLCEIAPDAVLVTGWQSRVLVEAIRAARRQGRPVVVRGESNDLRRRPLWKRLAHRLLCRQFAACLAIGKANRRFFLAAGVREERIFDSPYAVDNSRFGAAAEQLRPERPDLRRRWGIPDGSTCLLFAGKLQTKKRPFDLLAALARVVNGGPNFHLLIAGSGELEADLRETAARNGLPVSFAGFLNQSEMPRAYVAADALVLPSDSGETWGLVVNEAMACGLPAIVSRAVGCREDLVNEGETGSSFPPGDVAALGELLIAFAADPRRTAAMGDAARRHVRSRYSIERAVDGTMTALASLAAAAEPR